MLTKENVQKQLDEMPDEFTLDELIERLILMEKIQEGLRDSAEGRTISNDEMKKEIDSWFS